MRVWMRRLELAEPTALAAAARTRPAVWLATPEAIVARRQKASSSTNSRTSVGWPAP